MIQRSRNPLVVEVLRGPVVESSHQVVAVIAEDRGSVLGFYGNHEYVTFPRSAIKMLQALPMMESGAVEKFALDERMVALACASHAGEKQHLLVITQWLEKLQLTEEILRCGPAFPSHEGTRLEMLRKDLKPHRILHNCSGKHLGLVSAAMALGHNPANYDRWDHPIQIRVRKVLSEMMGIDHEKIPWGVDGCGIPTTAVPLQSVAIGLARMLSSSIGEARHEACRRLLKAMTTYPQLVGGHDEFASRLMEVTRGRVIAKSGAEGVFTALVPERRTAVALKAQDGSRRAVEVALGGVLKSLGALSDEEFQALRDSTHPAVKNSRGESVGEIRLQKGSF